MLHKPVSAPSLDRRYQPVVNVLSGAPGLPIPSGAFLLLEAGDYLLLENSKMMLSDSGIGRPSVVDGDDDGDYDDGGGFDNSANDIDLGNDAGTAKKGFFYFEETGIPQGSDIVDAYLIVTSAANLSDVTVNLKLVGSDEDDATVPLNKVDAAARPRTTAEVNWSNVEAWVADTEYQSPDIKTIVQEVVDRAGFGGAFLLFVEDNGSAVASKRKVKSYNGDPTAAAELYVRYWAPDTPIPTPPGTPSLIYDLFTTNDAAPIASPRNCEPGPGVMVNTDTESKMALDGGKLKVTGGKAAPAYGDPSAYFQGDGGGVGRGTYYEIELISRAEAGYAQIGLSNNTTLSTANTKHALYKPNTNTILFRDAGDDSTGQQYVMYLFPNRTYYLKCYVLSGGGCVWLAKGQQFGSTWKTLAYSENESDATVYPVILNYNAELEVNVVAADTITDPDLYLAYYNGSEAVGGTYAIGRAVSYDGFSLGRAVGNPVLEKGAGGAWDDDHVKDPWVLKDGATYKMWYAGHDGAKYQIGYATSADGITWSKSGSNPVLAVGGGGAWDEDGTLFPVVYKDAGAAAAKRWKMLYTGLNAAGALQIGYAYSADGITWNKGGANPVVAIGGGGTWEDEDINTGALVKDGATYYLFYGGSGTAGFPGDWQVGLVTFADFEGAYTKDAGNPIISNRNGNQALTAAASAGDTIVEIADSSVFAEGELVGIGDASNSEQNRVELHLSATRVQLSWPLIYGYSAATSYINAQCGSLTPRSAVYEDGTWKMLVSAFQWGDTNEKGEGMAYAESSDPDSGWDLYYDDAQPIMLPCNGWVNVSVPWDARSTENVVWCLDADTMERVTL